MNVIRRCFAPLSVALIAAAQFSSASDLPAYAKRKERPPVVIDSTWTQQQKIVASDGAAGDEFGEYVVALSGEKAFVSAPLATVGSNSHQGAVYVFMKSGSTWIQTQKLVASDGAALDFFGRSLAFDGPTGTLVVGANNKTLGSATQVGAVYTFQDSSGSYVQAQKLLASDGAQGDGFGTSVSISNNFLTVGAPGKVVSGIPHAGEAYVYRRPLGGTWSQTQILTTGSGQEEEFGQTVLVNATTIFIDANNYAPPAGEQVEFDIPGGVYVYNESPLCPPSAPCWAQSQVLVPQSFSDGEEFGAKMTTDGTTLLVGAPDRSFGITYAHSFQGSVVVFHVSGATWSETQELTSLDGGHADGFGDGLALLGTTALIGAPRNIAAGSVYAFTSSGGVWSQSQEFSATDGAGADHFGSGVSASGTTALIAAPGATVGSNATQGAAYLFGD